MRTIEQLYQIFLVFFKFVRLGLRDYLPYTFLGSRDEVPQVKLKTPSLTKIAMPGSFNGCGVQFLYPENWTVTDQTEEEGGQVCGVTVESPLGAFFSLNRYPNVTLPKSVIDQATEAMRGEYNPIEVVPYEAEDGFVQEAATELSFYYLDLLIVCRMVAIVDRGDVLLVQMQGENRDFDSLEPVFLAMLKSLRDSIR